jgi:hypothetical protein
MKSSSKMSDNTPDASPGAGGTVKIRGRLAGVEP